MSGGAGRLRGRPGGPIASVGQYRTELFPVQSEQWLPGGRPGPINSRPAPRAPAPAPALARRHRVDGVARGAGSGPRVNPRPAGGGRGERPPVRFLA